MLRLVAADRPFITKEIIRFESQTKNRTYVEPRLRDKNQKIMASGPDLELPLARERQTRASVA
jgi:hypothetical protein